MSNIRRQSIISSLVIYFGFAVGLMNTYFFTKEGIFTEAEYGLTTIFIAISSLMAVFASLAMPSYIYKFYPYYNDNLPPRKNDMLTWALIVSTIGFILVMIAGVIFKSLVIRKFGENSPQLVMYYYWLFPMGLGITVYTILEAYTIMKGKSVLTTFLREVQWRLFTTVLIILMITQTIKNFDLFIKLYSFGYLFIAIVLFFYLAINKKLQLTFTISRVTRKFFKKILTLCYLFYGATIIFIVSRVFDTIIIASKLPDGAAKAGVFAIATLMTSIIQAPQRGIIAAAIPHLSRAWKDKNLGLLQRIYQRSSLNQLIFACALFLLIWLNFTDAVYTFNLKPIYLDAKWVFFVLGLTMIIDMGTGVNAQIISTSNYWRFELFSGVILLFIMLPLTYVFTVKFGIIGPAFAYLISITIYNSIRIIFLWKKFRLFPFTLESLYTIILAAGSYAICFFAFKNIQGIAGMFIRSILFMLLYGAGVTYFKLSPDIQPVITTIKKRLGFLKKD